MLRCIMLMQCRFATVMLGLASGCAPATEEEPEYWVDAEVIGADGVDPALCLSSVMESNPPQCRSAAVVRDLDWAEVPWAERASGITWAFLRLRGTFDLRELEMTLTAPPEPGQAPVDDEPDVDLSALCDAPTGDTASLSPFRYPWSTDSVVVGLWTSQEPEAINVEVRPGEAEAFTARVREDYDGPLCVVEADRISLLDLTTFQSNLLAASRGKRNAFGPIMSSDVLSVRQSKVLIYVIIADDSAREWAAEHGGDLIELRGVLTPVREGGST